MSFVNSIFLFATAAAVLPILIHLVRRMKARTVPFSSLMFLKATPKELVRKRRLRDKLLMAARAALLALLALVFARPFIPADKLPLVPTRDSESVVVLIDRSFSMRYADAFERALAAARSRMAGMTGSDEIAVIAFDDHAELLAELDTDEVVRQASLADLQPGYRATDFFPALQRAEDVLQDARNKRRVIVMISDFQEAGWTGTLENWKLQEGIAFEPLAIRSPSPRNAYVEAVALSKKTADGQGIARLDGLVSSDDEAGPRSVTLTVDGNVSERHVLSPARNSVSFQQVLARSGYFQGSLSLESDDLDGDNHFYFTDHYEGLPQIHVVDAASSRARSDGFFIRSAFDLGDASKFQVSQAQQISAARLREVDVLFLTVGGALSPSDRNTLKSYVENGGTLVLSTGSAADPTDLSATLQTLELGSIDRLVDARADLGYEVILGEVDTGHPIFEPFASSRSGAILRPKIRRYAHFSPGEETRVLGRFDSGDPFLVERTLGHGRVLFYASTFGTDWTDMALDEMFVPFLYELVEYGMSRSDVHRNVLVGAAVTLAGEPGETVEVRTPEGRLHRVDLDESGRGYFRQTDVPGHYAAATAAGPVYFSVNVDRRESVLRARDTEEVYAAVMPPPSEAPTTPAEAAAVIEDEERDQKLWRYLLLAVVALFGLETYMANRRSDSPRNGAQTWSANGRGADTGRRRRNGHSDRRTDERAPSSRLKKEEV